MAFIKFAVVLLSLLLSAHANVDILPNVTISTWENSTFTRNVYDIKPHPNGTSLIVTVGYALLKVEIPTGLVTNIAGNPTSHGYTESVGESARFRDLYSLLVTDKNKVVVSDHGNHCLREVNLTTRRTSRLVGICTTTGYINGYASQAKFHYQRGIASYKDGILIADRNNNAIRLFRGGSVSTLVSGSPVIYPMYITEADGVVYITTGPGVVRLNPDTGSTQLIAGTTSTTGLVDGPLLNARFSYPNGLASLAPGLILVAEYNYHRMRLVDTEGNIVRSICTGSAGHVDGNGETCSLYSPSAVIIINETIYIGEYQSIRTMPVQQIRDWYKITIESCPNDVQLEITAGQKPVYHSWEQPVVSGEGRIDCISCPSMNARLFDPGRTEISYFFHNNYGFDNKTCSFTVTVIEKCPQTHMKLNLRPGEHLAEIQIGDTTLHLAEGIHKIVTKLANGSSCLTDVDVSDKLQYPPGIKNCPRNVVLQLPLGQNTLKYSWKEPTAYGTGKIICQGCPNVTSMNFGLGSSRISYVFVNEYGVNSTCSFTVTVEEVCPQALIEVSLKPGQKQAEVETPGGLLKLAAGEYQVITKLSNGTRCLTIVRVKVEYEAVCPILDIIHLTQRETLVNVSWNLPELKGVDQNEVSCLSCPPTTIELGVGVHTIEYVYLYNVTGYTLDCSFDVVIMNSRSSENCSSVVVLGLKKGEETASFVVKSGTKYVSVDFPVGVHNINTDHESGRKCETTVKVFGTEPIRRRVALEVSYLVNCERLNHISYAVINSGLLQHYLDIEQNCARCKLPKTPENDIRCNSGVLTVLWRTNIKPELKGGMIPGLLKSSLVSDLTMLQNTQLKARGRFLDITLIDRIPTILSPVKDTNGLFIKVEVVSTCPLVNMVYDETDDACYVEG